MAEFSLVFRVIPYAISSFEKLHLPAAMQQFADYQKRGLVLVTGPTGSGKSTTLSSFIDYINANYQKHIITIEDPVEFVFTDKKCKVSQRQVGIDTPTFLDGLKYALRQDPNVILIGEIRDEETIVSALKAAETGHLVFATLHTNNAVQTVQRAISFYDPKDREYIRLQVSSALRGIVSQKLIPSTDGQHRVPALEVLTVTPTIRDLIEKDRLDEIYELNRQGGIAGLITMNSQLHELVKNSTVTKEDAIMASYNKNELELLLKGVYYGTRSEN